MKHLAFLTILLLALFLRTFKLSTLPNGLHWDEMDTGYQAYSLLKTGKDYHKTTFPLFPHSIADYRTPVYIYSAVPLVANLGLTSLSVRLPSVLWSMLGIIGIYLLGSYLFKNCRLGLISALALSLSPWHVQYSRQSVETISLATLLIFASTLFIRGLTHPKYLPLSGLFFGLSVAAYSPGKLFVPLFLFALTIIYRKTLININPKILIFSCIAFLSLFLPVLIDGLIGNSGMRFRELSVFTDPTVAETVKWRREELAVTSGVPKAPGMSPRFIDRAIYNKLTLWGKSISDNYLSAFSTEYLFIKGDRELRHSPAKESYGMLLLPDVVPLTVGLLSLGFIIPRASAIFLGLWLVLAPLPGALTRWDNPHAARLLIMLPALILISSHGMQLILNKSRLLFSVIIFSTLVAGLFSYLYFFNNYSWESAPSFQYGQTQAVLEAINLSKAYDQVVLDFYSDSPLMAYLFSTKFDPKALQSLQPLPISEPLPGVPAQKFGNLLLLLPGHRAWENLRLEGRNLYVVSSNHPSVQKLPPPFKTILYPDSTPAFMFFSF